METQSLLITKATVRPASKIYSARSQGSVYWDSNIFIDPSKRNLHSSCR